MYRIMDEVFYFKFFLWLILYRFFFIFPLLLQGAGLHPLVFFSSSWQVCFIFLPPRSFSLDKMAKSWAFFLTSRLVVPLLFPPNRFFPMTFPAMTKRGTPAVQIPFFLSNNLNAGPLALHETGHVYWAEPGPRSHYLPPPHLVWSRLLGPDESVNCCCFLSMGGVGVERGRGGGEMAY